MRRRRPGLAPVLFPAILAVVLSTLPATAAEPPRAERPTYQIGDKWIRSDGTYALTRIDRDSYVFEAGRGNEIRLSKNLELERVVKDGRVEFDVDPGTRLNWPLEAGRTHSYSTLWRGPVARPPLGGSSPGLRVTLKIEAESTITVPAGTFRAYRITQVGDTAGMGGFPVFDLSLWYAPEARRFVKGESTRQPALNFELTGLDDRAPPVIATTPKVERPTYKIGDKWIRSDGTYALTRIDKDVYVFEAGRGNEIRLSKNLELQRVTKDGRVEFDLDPGAWMPWPLEAGRTHAYPALWRGPAMRRPMGVVGSDLRIVSKIEAESSVTVPAGTFRAYRVTQIGYVGSSAAGYQLFDLSLWYAPEARRFVKGESRQQPALNFELTGLDDRAPPVIATTPRVERPTYQTGDKWIRSDGTYALTRIDKDVYVFEAGPGNEIRLSKNLELGRVTKDGRVEFDLDPGAWIPWPLEAGRTHYYQALWRGAAIRIVTSGNSSDLRIVSKIEAESAITVPAGTFRAYRITQNGYGAVRTQGNAGTTAGGGGVELFDLSLWYAPEARRFVKGESTTMPALNFELTGLDDRAPPVIAAPVAPPATPPTPAPTRPTIAAPAPPQRPAPAPPLPTPVVTPPVSTGAPKIAINYPPPDTRVEGESIVVTGLVTHDAGVDRVQIAINGVVLPQPRDVGAIGRAVPIRAPATLRPGNNLIEVTATDKAGNVSQVVRPVTRVGPAVVATPGSKIVDRWAVVIGVGEYDNRAIPKLRYATRDADAMYQFLTTQGGYPADHVLRLTDSSGQKPTLLNIKRALGTFLARRAGRDDMVLIYYAGHGAPEADQAGAETDGLSKYLVPRDADPEALYSTALPMEEIRQIFSRILAPRIVMLLDTCYSGTAGGRTFSRTSTRSSGLNDQFLERLTLSRGRLVMTASGPNEVALEVASLAHGLFTYYVLEGLRGKADRNGDGIVTYQELYEYVEDQVDRAARRLGGRQRPSSKGEFEGALPLTTVGK